MSLFLNKGLTIAVLHEDAKAHVWSSLRWNWTGDLTALIGVEQIEKEVNCGVLCFFRFQIAAGFCYLFFSDAYVIKDTVKSFNDASKKLENFMKIVPRKLPRWVFLFRDFLQ